MFACPAAGIADVDTRAITRRLRDTGALNGIITTDMSTPAEELVQKTKSWSILGKDLISEVSGGMFLRCGMHFYPHTSRKGKSKVHMCPAMASQGLCMHSPNVAATYCH